MELKTVRAFLAVVQTKGFAKAGEVLGLTQPAVTHIIQGLESELGTLLIDRNRGGARLTAAGRDFLGPAQELIRVAEEAQHALSVWRGVTGGWLRIGHSPAHRELAAAAVVNVLREVSGLRVTLEEAISPQIEARVSQGALDVGLVHTQAEPEHVAYLKLTDTALRLAVNPKHRLATSLAIELTALKEEPFVLTRGGRRSGKAVWSYFRKHKFDPKVAIEANTMVTVFTVVRGSPDLVTLMPIPAPQAGGMQGLAFIDVLPLCRTEGSFLVWSENETERPWEATAKFRHAVMMLLGLQPEKAT